MYKRILCSVVGLISIFLIHCGDIDSNSDNSSNPALQPGTQIGLLIDRGDEGGQTFHGLSFTNTDVNGLNALLASELSVVSDDFGSLGVFVCGIDNVGGFANNSCVFDSANQNYWAFYYRRSSDLDWTFSDVGLSSLEFNDGDMFAMIWTNSPVVNGVISNETIIQPDSNLTLSVFFQ